MSVAKFNFSDNNALELDIAGKVYKIDVMDVAVVQKMQNFSAAAIEKGNALLQKAEETDYESAVLDACNFCGDAINQILGDGAYKEIFANRTVNFIDHIELLNFITAEITKFRSERLAVYTPNRATRRAQGSAKQ